LGAARISEAHLKVFAEEGISFASGAVFLQSVPPLDTGRPEPEPSPPAGITSAAVATMVR
jgi:hypothetical protein